VSVEAFHGAVNAVSPSFIRVEADEATYNLHIMIRFELEQALLNEDLSADAVPAAWNDKYQSYLGITPPNDALGCLQDIHWSAGLVGYFPTYTLGNMYAAQLVAALERDLGSLDALIRRGAFADILAWLRDRIHRHGKRYEPAELIQQVTGESLSADPLLEQLRAKYAAIYSF
jgi:carboxypeptidase Taq